MEQERKTRFASIATRPSSRSGGRPAAATLALLAGFLFALPLCSRAASAQEPAAAPAAAGPEAGTCGDDPFRLFDVTEASELSRMMGIQAGAERFLAGTRGEEGGSVQGKLFGDLGTLIAEAGSVAPQGKAAAAAWSAFSGAVSTSAEAASHLYPGKMELVVHATPTSFQEDATTVGSWTVGATAATELWNLSEEILQEALSRALEGALDPVFDDAGSRLELVDRERMTPARRRLLEIADGLIEDKTGGDALAKFSAAQLSAFLNAIGASEGPNGFFMPPQCWEVGNGWDGWAFAEVDGRAIELVGDRGFVPREAGVATLRIWTVEGRQAFGNSMRSASVEVEVRPIEVELRPSIQKVKAGADVPFFAAVRGAVDSGMEWRASAGRFVDRQPAEEGAETAVLETPEDPASYPIEVEVRSTSTSGARGLPGAQPRLATAVVQLDDPIIDVSPGGCVSVGEERQFTAQVLGAESQQVTWSARGPDGGAMTGHGRFSSSREGTYTVQAAWAEDPAVTAEVEVRVAEACDNGYSLVTGGDVILQQEGPPGSITGVRPSSFGDGLCTVGINVALPGEGPDLALRLTAALPDGLRDGSYPVARGYTSIEKLGERSHLVYPLDANHAAERASPGLFHVGASLTNYEHSRVRGDGRIMGGRKFVGEMGSISIKRLDGNRIEIMFDATLLETDSEGEQVARGGTLETIYYPLRRFTVQGWLRSRLHSSLVNGSIYLCEPLEPASES